MRPNRAILESYRVPGRWALGTTSSPVPPSPATYAPLRTASLLDPCLNGTRYLNLGYLVYSNQGGILETGYYLDRSHDWVGVDDPTSSRIGMENRLYPGYTPPMSQDPGPMSQDPGYRAREVK